VGQCACPDDAMLLSLGRTLARKHEDGPRMKLVSLTWNEKKVEGRSPSLWLRSNARFAKSAGTRVLVMAVCWTAKS